MKSRVQRKNRRASYANATIDPRWMDFATFYADMGECPKDWTLDRINTENPNYEPGNCRWATISQQCDNRRVSVRVLIEGCWMTRKEAAELLEVSVSTIQDRVRSKKIEERELYCEQEGLFK